MDKFTITAYTPATDTATVTFILANREGFTGATFTGVKLKGVPKDSIDNVKVFMRNYIDAYINGKRQEEREVASVSTEVATLLNKQIEV